VSRLGEYVAAFSELGMRDVARVGGKNASLGEMIGRLARLGLKVPAGFATPADAYREFLAQDGLAGRIEKTLAHLNIDNVEELARVGSQIRGWVLAPAFPPALERAMRGAWEGPGGADTAVALRSSATAEDLP